MQTRLYGYCLIGRFCRFLQRLDLSNNSIGADGATVLAQQAAQHWRNMQHLQFNGNAIGNAGAQALAEHAAPYWLGLMRLELQQNGISNRGAAALAEPAVLQKWKHMQQLDLRCNSISAECSEILRMAAVKMWQRPGAILV
jgi:Ran GTPase-activating protein (RanGAP) involved in mRNA processing and transport